MGRAIIMHIDEAPWVRGGPRGEGDNPEGGGQLVGDLERGPWVHVNWLPPGLVAPVHSHGEDEVMFVLEGGFSMGARECGPGTVVYIENDTKYGLRIGDEGVRFLNIRGGRAHYTVDAETIDPYSDRGEDSE